MTSSSAGGQLAGKVALVTGASRGIGRAVASKLAAEGAIVVGTATSEAGAASINEYLQAISSNSVGRVLNVCEVESIQVLVSEVTEQFGAPTLLVNNAAITNDNLLLRMKPDDWHQVVKTNLDSIFYMSKSVLKGMSKARFGRIINISSVVAQRGNPGQVNYCAAKAGVEGFTRSLAIEMAARGITVNAVAPGFIETDMTEALNDAQRSAILNEVPTGRLGRPDEIAAVVAFLASESAAYINGAVLPVNGGLYLG